MRAELFLVIFKSKLKLGYSVNLFGHMFGRQLQKLIKMINSVKNRADFISVPIRCSYTKLKRVPVERNGYAVSEIQYCEHDCAEQCRGVKPIDFSITNLLAVGAYGVSAPSYLRSATDFTFIDKFEISKLSHE